MKKINTNGSKLILSPSQSTMEPTSESNLVQKSILNKQKSPLKGSAPNLSGQFSTSKRTSQSTANLVEEPTMSKRRLSIQSNGSKSSKHSSYKDDNAPKLSLSSYNAERRRSSFTGSTSAMGETEDSKVDLKKQTGFLNSLMECDCAPDFYGTFLGPTADETVLKGLVTLRDFCMKLSSCGEKEPPVAKRRASIVSVEAVVTKETVPEVQQEPPEPEPEESATKSTIIEASLPEMVVEILQTVGITPELASKIAQTSFEALAEEKPSMYDKLMQTSTVEVVSEILQTLGLSAELASKIIQTSLVSLRSGRMQTSIVSAKSEGIQPSFKESSATTIYKAEEPIAVQSEIEPVQEEPSIRCEEAIYEEPQIIRKCCHGCRCSNRKVFPAPSQQRICRCTKYVNRQPSPKQPYCHHRKPKTVCFCDSERPNGDKPLHKRRGHATGPNTFSNTMKQSWNSIQSSMYKVKDYFGRVKSKVKRPSFVARNVERHSSASLARGDNYSSRSGSSCSCLDDDSDYSN